MRRRVVLFLCLWVGLLPCWGQASSSQLDLHQNGFLAATDGEDAFFFLRTAAGKWGIQSASNHYLGQEMTYWIAEDQVPFALLYADARYLWYACYSHELRYEQEDTLWAAAEVFRLDRESGQAARMIANLDPEAVFPADGSAIYYSPYEDASQLWKLDFITGNHMIVAQLPGQRIWMAGYSGDSLYLVVLDEEQQEQMVRITGGVIQPVDEPSPEPAISWIQGDFRGYVLGEGTQIYLSALRSPSHSFALDTVMNRGAIYRYGNVLLSVYEDAQGIGNIYYANLNEGEQGMGKSVYFQTPPYYFAFGYGGGDLIALDGIGRLLRVRDEFETLEQVARLDMPELYEEGVWLWTLPFDDFVLMLGHRYEEEQEQSALSIPETIARVVPLGEKMDQGEDAGVGQQSWPDNGARAVSGSPSVKSRSLEQ